MGRRIARYGRGKMDQFDLIGLGTGASGDDSGDLLTCHQFTSADIPNYFAYAHNFALGASMFFFAARTQLPKYLYTIAADSFGVIDNPFHLLNTYQLGLRRSKRNGSGASSHPTAERGHQRSVPLFHRVTTMAHTAR